MSFYFPDGYNPNAKLGGELYPEAMRELALPAESVKLPSFENLNKVTGGFRPKEFSILCGATGVGKTCFLANISADLISQNTPHFVASVETGPTDFIKRVIASMIRKDINGGDAIPIDLLKKIHVDHGGTLGNNALHLSLYDNRIPVDTLLSDIEWHVEKRGCKIAMLDNLNFFLEITRSSDSLVEMDRVIHELIIFCKKVPVHLIMVMHPKKTDHGRVESEFDIKGSSTAVQEAHNIFLLNRAHPESIKSGNAEASSRELKIAKMRRRGKYVGNFVMFNSRDGVSYQEDGLYESTIRKTYS